MDQEADYRKDKERIVNRLITFILFFLFSGFYTILIFCLFIYQYYRTSYILGIIILICLLIIFIFIIKKFSVRKNLACGCISLIIFLTLFPYLLILIMRDNSLYNITKHLFIIYYSFLLVICYKVSSIIKSYIKHVNSVKKEYEILANYEYENKLLGEIYRSMLHDIVTPLSILSGTLELIEKRGIEEKEREKFKEIFKISFKEVEEIMQYNILLTKNPNNKEYFNPNIQVEKCMKLLSNMVKSKGIKVTFNSTYDKNFYGDKVIFFRIFLNIYSNAIEELQRINKKEKIIDIQLYSEEEYLVLKIKDNGNGIETKQVNGLSTLHTSKKNSSHIGSGLAFVKITIQEKFKGFIKIETEKGIYTEVNLYFQITNQI